MIVELPARMQISHDCVYAKHGLWHITRGAYTYSNTEAWMAYTVCDLNVAIIITANTQGKDSKWCPECVKWAADRIIRQDFS